MQDHDLDAPLGTVRKPHGRSRLFLEDDPSMSPEVDDASMSLEDDASMSVMPSATKRIFRASSVFLLVFVVLAGVGVALVWRSFGDQATNMISAWALPAATSKPTASPEELQEQLKSIATDLAALRQTLEQQSVANHDQLTHIQEQIAEQSIALQSTKQELSEKLSSPPPADKPVPIPPRKPAQHPAQLSTQESSKPIQVSPPQSLLPPKQ
jgi:ribosomal protein L29